MYIPEEEGGGNKCVCTFYTLRSVLMLSLRLIKTSENKTPLLPLFFFTKNAKMSIKTCPILK